MTAKKELEEYLDREFAVVVQRARALNNASARPLDDIAFSGTVTGMLLKTALKLAHDHHAPRHIIEKTIALTIESLWGKAKPPYNR